MGETVATSPPINDSISFVKSDVPCEVAWGAVASGRVAKGTAIVTATGIERFAALTHWVMHLAYQS